METIIGLGKTGCAIADHFASYDQYNIYKIGLGLKGLKKNGVYDFPKQANPEEYEAKCPSMKNFFKNCSGEVLFIVDGSEEISAATLRILENVKKKNCHISILYIKQDMEYFSNLSQMTNRIAFNVLQEYTRSAVFDRIFLVDLLNIEHLVEHAPLAQQSQAAYETIVSTLHMINVYNHIDSVTDTFSDPPETARIATIGYGQFERDLSYFFTLDKTREIRYYYGINKERLDSEKGLLKKIKAQLKENNQEGIKASYGIYSTNYEQDYVYTLALSSEIQEG